MLQCNIRGFSSHCVELEGQLRLLPTRPEIVCLNETLLEVPLDATAGRIELEGYTLISRRERDDGRVGGGIALFALDSIAPQVVLLEHSKEHERSWHAIHTDIGPVLLCVWYRPPCPGEIRSIQSCEEEWRRLSASHVATMIIGDLNVHHTRWLKHSTSVSVEGTSLFRFCLAQGLKQQVTKPTRDENLLDLVISDLKAVKVSVLPKVSDHNMVAAEFDLGVPPAQIFSRTVFDYAKANWNHIRRDYRVHEWAPMDTMEVDDAERYMHDKILEIIRRHVPERMIWERRSVHPWINERCVQAIRDKNNAADGAQRTAAARCSEILFEEYLAYVQRMRDKLGKAKRGSKLWWKLSSEIVGKSGKASSIPAMKSPTGWVLEPAGKAELFADTFSTKFGIPDIEFNEYSALPPEYRRSGYIPVRVRHTQRVM